MIKYNRKICYIPIIGLIYLTYIYRDLFFKDKINDIDYIEDKETAAIIIQIISLLILSIIAKISL
jgi:hypothetical protein